MVLLTTPTIMMFQAIFSSLPTLFTVRSHELSSVMLK
jgi:hypothetical protein